jgi:hypothetical protein
LREIDIARGKRGLDFVFCDLTVESLGERLIADGDRIVRCGDPITRGNAASHKKAGGNRK